MAGNNLKNLDLQNLYLLNQPTKLLIGLFAVIGVLGLGYAGVFKTQLDTLSAAENKEKELKETYTSKSIEAASLHNLKAELASIRSAFDVLLKQLPTDAEIPNLIQELHQAGSSNGLRLDSVTPSAPTNDGPIQKLPYEISITGKYNQISQFTKDVGNLSRIITLESLKINQAAADKDKGNKGDLLTMSATAVTYKARPAEEVAAELAEKAQQQAENQENAPKSEK